MDINVSLTSPFSYNFIGGICSPSSNTSLGSGDRIFPPISGAWAVLAANPIIFAPLKIGRQTEISGRWPVPICGSFVMRISPGNSVLLGNLLMKCFTVSGKVPINEGMLSVACTSAFPCSSVTTQEKS